jgi:hypothetical protein
MKIKRKIVLIFLILMLISAGIVAAQSSANFKLQRFVMVGGGSADSNNYAVTSVFGQPATNPGASANYTLSPGFLYPRQQNLSDFVWIPVVRK